jgi:hypothetical protein
MNGDSGFNGKNWADVLWPIVLLLGLCLLAWRFA